MLISNTHRAIFLHIPKTAGTSITNLIEPELRWNDLVLGGTQFGERIGMAYRERFGLSKHMTAREVRMIVGEDLWKAYFKFAIVRHPYTRLVSFYNWKKGAISRASPDSPLWHWPATEAFLKSSNFSEFIRHEKFLSSRAAWPQADWLCDEAGTCLVDFVGRFEELGSAIQIVAKRLGLLSVDLQVHNSSNAESSPGDLMQGNYEFVQDFYRRDLEMFCYDPKLRL
jgi:hypothetical protein